MSGDQFRNTHSPMTNIQVMDDPALLEVMNADMKRASHLYNPTNYWSYYEQFFVPELQERGLIDFRRRKGSVLRSFGATDCKEQKLVDLRHNRLLYNRFLTSIPGWGRLIDSLSNALSKLVAFFPSWKTAREQRPIQFAESCGNQCGAPPLGGLDISLAGNPEDVVYSEGRPYTYSMLYYYMRFAFACRGIDFAKVETVAELGSGSGKNVEIVMKYNPHLTYLIFDISPQLYVCEQYLRAVFGDRVVSYRENRTRTGLDNLEKGKIYLFGAWHFPLLAEYPVDVFWNCASLQEMEPDVALNYLNFVNQSARMVYLMAKMNGQRKAEKDGTPGVIDPVVFEHYEKGLSNFALTDVADCYYPNGRRMWDGYQETIWKRK